MSCSKQPDNSVLERPAPCRTPTVLCIDDDPHVSEVIQDRLEAYEVRLLRAFFGTQGIWMAVTQDPDVIICDLRMPQGTAPPSSSFSSGKRKLPPFPSSCCPPCTIPGCNANSTGSGRRAT